MNLLGTVIDRYQVEAQLGQGSYGAVYRARHTVLDTLVALKVLWPDKADDPKNVERFLREARAAASVGSEHIVRVIDAGTTPDGVVFLALELLDGQDLSEMLKSRGWLPAEEAVGLAMQVLEGLGAAHQQGIVHRDLKPANVFLTRDGGIKILDFGISKILGAESLTERGMALGTPRYMAPEQLSGARVDARADLYAVGVMLYQLICGAPPYEGTGYELIVRRVKGESPIPLGTRASVPPVLEEVVHRALANEPEARWPTAGSLRRALSAALRGERPPSAALTVNPAVSPLSGPVQAQSTAAAEPTENLRARAPAATAGMPESIPPRAPPPLQSVPSPSGLSASRPSLRTARATLASSVQGPAWGWAAIAGLAVLCALVAGVFGVLAWRVGSRKGAGVAAPSTPGQPLSPGVDGPVAVAPAPIVPMPPPSGLPAPAPAPDPERIEFELRGMSSAGLRAFLDALRPRFAECAIGQPEQVPLVVQVGPDRAFAVEHSARTTDASECVVNTIRAAARPSYEARGRVVVHLPARGSSGSAAEPDRPSVDPSRVTLEVDAHRGRETLVAFVESLRPELAACAEDREVSVPLSTLIGPDGAQAFEHPVRSSSSAAATRCIVGVFQSAGPPDNDASGDVTVGIPARGAPAAPAPNPLLVRFQTHALNFGSESVLRAFLEALRPRFAACALPHDSEVRVMASMGPDSNSVSEMGSPGAAAPSGCVIDVLQNADRPSEDVVARFSVHLSGSGFGRL
ncbi:MAG: protein kinase [Sandaracinaceae bacterium]